MVEPNDGTLTSTATLGQSGPRSIGYEGILHIPQISRNEPHYQMQFSSHIPDMGVGEGLPHCKAAVDILYWPSQQGDNHCFF